MSTTTARFELLGAALIVAACGSRAGSETGGGHGSATGAGSAPAAGGAADAALPRDAGAGGGAAGGGGAGGAPATGGYRGVAPDGAIIRNYTPLDPGSRELVRDMPPGGTLLGESGSPEWMYKSVGGLFGVAFVGNTYEGVRRTDTCTGCRADEYCFTSPQPSHAGAAQCVTERGECPLGCSGPVCALRPRSCYSDCPGACGCDMKLYCNACIAAAWGVEAMAALGSCGPLGVTP